MKKNRVALAMLAAGTGIVLALAPAVAANAASYSGQRLCSGAKLPLLTINSAYLGDGNFSKYDDPANVSPFSFPGGYSQKYSPYQRTYWAVASNGVYSAPSSTCY